MGVQNSIDRLNSIKERIRVNLVAQGLTVPDDAMLADMAEQILSVAGENGRGIVSIERTSGTGAAGTTDTYTITYTDKTTSTFTVRNGANGATYTLTAADKTEIAEEAAGKVDVSGKLDKAGGTMTGVLKAQNNSQNLIAQVRNAVFVPEGDEPPEIGEGDFILFFKEPDA